MTATRSRLQQQRPADRIARMQQQQTGSNEFRGPPQAAGSAGTPQMGEGNVEADRAYRQSAKRYLQQADVAADAAHAAPRSAEEARELARAEREARSHAKGER
jgi:hypothetical protein